MTSLFSAASAPTLFVGRKTEMMEVRKQVYKSGDDLRVVLLVGDGGIGKTRMLSEIRQAITGEHDGCIRTDLAWSAEESPVLVSTVFDLEPVRLSTTLRFVNDLVNAIDPQQEGFPRFRTEHAKHRQALVFQSSYSQIQRMLYAALRAFQADYTELTASRRVVLLLDTGERFAVPIPFDFDAAAEKILAESESDAKEERLPSTPIYTVQWLRQVIASEDKKLRLKNTTIIMAGRPHSNWWDVFHDLPPTAVTRVAINSLLDTEIPAYFSQLLQDLSDIKRFPKSREMEYAIDRLQRYTDTNAAWILWSLTEGRPVRLALISDLILDGMTEPPELEWSRAEAEAIFGWNESTRTFDHQDKLLAAQHSLDEQFVATLFDSTTSLRALILALLVRAHHPLDAEILEYLIYSEPEEHYVQWIEEGHSSPLALGKIETELHWLRNLAFFKNRNVAFGSNASPQLQVFLQDVMYEIFDNYFATVNESSRAAEIAHRTEIYTKLIEVLTKRIEDCEQGLRETWLDERWSLETELRSQPFHALHGMQALHARFPESTATSFSYRSQMTREALRDHLEELLLERLYYSLRINPKQAMNNEYSQLADSAWLEHDEDFMTQIEVQVWRLLNDTSAQKLMDISLDPPPSLGALRPGHPDRYDPWKRLRRIALQDHALRWLKRLHLRERYDEVSKMATVIRSYAMGLSPDTNFPDAEPPSSDYHSWNHTLTQQEICVYEGYAYAYIGKTAEAIALMESVVVQLEDVLIRGHPERNEKPFLDAAGSKKDHGATYRVRSALGIAQFVLGYSHAAHGDFAKAHDAYNKALLQLRRTRFISLEVYCRFNMGRALAELGFTAEAAKNCEDALNLLTNAGKGGTLPFALASNTLALVYNAERTLEEAWLNAAVAHACFQRMAEERGVVLSQLQLGEALRRMADRQDRQEYSPDRRTPRQIYLASEDVLRFAYDSIRSSATLGREKQRRAEAAIELASSLRDQVRVLDITRDKVVARDILRRAHKLFEEAGTIAASVSHSLLQLDALWGLATLQYRASRAGVGQYLERTDSEIPLTVIVQAFTGVAKLAFDLKLILPEAEISVSNPHPSRDGSKVRAIRRLGRVYGRLGRIYAEEFSKRNDMLRRSYGLLPYVPVEEDVRRSIQTKVLEDDVAAKYLWAAADNYVRAIAYAELYNPNATLIEYIFGDMYDRAKGFNGIVMGRFLEELSNAEKTYNVKLLAAAPTESVSDFLIRSFGNYLLTDAKPF